jgi:hypothetical protein
LNNLKVDTERVLVVVTDEDNEKAAIMAGRNLPNVTIGCDASWCERLRTSLIAHKISRYPVSPFDQVEEALA